MLVVNKDGNATQAVVAPRLKKLSDVKDKALMVHVGGDNMSDQPKPLGGGGARYACGGDQVSVPMAGACSSCDSAQYKRQITEASSRAAGWWCAKHGANPLQLCQRGGQRSLLNATLTHHIIQQCNAAIPHPGQRIGTAFPVAQLPPHASSSATPRPSVITSVAPAHPDCC